MAARAHLFAAAALRTITLDAATVAGAGERVPDVAYLKLLEQ